MAKRASRRKTKRVRTRRDQTLSDLLRSSEGRSALAVSTRAEAFLADSVVPPGTVLDAIVRALKNHTDMPPMLGVGTAMALASAALSQAGAVVRWPGETQDIELAQWIVMLAPSGAGKSFIRSAVQEALDLELSVLPEPASGPAFLASLAEAGGRSFWPRDEYGQAIRAMNRNGNREDMRDLLLQTYDHTELVHSTRTRGETRVQHPVLTILGTSVDATWGDCVDAQMLVDGLAARHLYLVAEARSMTEPRYPRDRIIDEIRSAGGDLGQSLSQQRTYQITPNADAVYHQLWHELVGDLGDSLDAAYVRRITWAAARYSVIYHLFTGGESERVGVTAMRWAWRMVMLHCHCTKLALDLADGSPVALYLRMDDWVREQRRAGVNIHAREFPRRLFQRFSRDLTSMSEARLMLNLVLLGQ